MLAPHGSICVELGDTYSGSGGAGGDYTEGGIRAGQNGFTGSAHRSRHEQPRQWSGGAGWPLAKSMCGIPHLYHLSLAYGRNLLTGEPSPAGQWRVRNVVAWCRPNPPVGALGDKFRPATSYLTIATKAKDRYFDLDAVRGEPSPNTHARTAKGVDRRTSTGKTADDRRGGNWSTLDTQHRTTGAPPLDYWVIPPAPYAGSHYAVYPPALCERPIESMVPRRVCTVCGEPSRRIVEMEPEYAAARAAVGDFKAGSRDTGLNGTTQYVNGQHMDRAKNVTVGWTACGHDHWRTGVVLDPFAGSGTTLMVATGHGRDAIGIDIDARNADLALDRVGPLLLTVEHHTPEAAA